MFRSKKLIIIHILVLFILFSLIGFSIYQTSKLNRLRIVIKLDQVTKEQSTPNPTPTLFPTPTPSSFKGLGYDPTVYPLKNYKNETYGFSFNFQKWSVSEQTTSGKELLVLGLGETLGNYATIKVIDIKEAKKAALYQAENNPQVANLEFEISKLPSEKFNGWKVLYKTKQLNDLVDIVISNEKYSYSISGTNERVEGVLQSWEFIK